MLFIYIFICIVAYTDLAKLTHPKLDVGFGTKKKLLDLNLNSVFLLKK